MIWTPPEYVAALEGEGTTVCRIASAEALRIERFGPGVIISHREREVRPDLIERIDAWAARAGIALDRIYERQLVIGPGETDKPRPLRGGELDSVLTVQELGLHYEVDFLAGYSCGLFIDQRHNRKYLLSLRPRRVLNTFSYTCAFSIAAASIGAETLSVDLAKVALSRGRRNLELNGIAPEGHRFIADDVLDVLPRLVRRGEKYDAIILDPPTFARGAKGRPFRVERDMEKLLSLALEVGTPGGWILLSTNASELQLRDLRSMARRQGCDRFHEEPLPEDLSHGPVSMTVWVRIP